MSTVVHLLPIALAVAISSVPITITILILLSPDRTRSAVPFLIGWVVGIVVTISVAALFAQVIPTPRSDRQPDTAVGIAEIVVGVAVIALGVLSWLRQRRGTAPTTPKTTSAESKLGPWSALGLGFVLNLRPKGILLAIAGGLTLHADAGSLQAAIVPIVVYTVVAASTVALPVIVTSVAPERTKPRLLQAHDWLVRHGGALTSVILVLIGIVIVYMGVARL